MNNDMKCPVCGKQMKIGTLDTDDSMGTVWMSIMPRDCVCSYGASKAVWQELIRARKALDAAVEKAKALKELADIAGFSMFSAGCQDIIDQINNIKGE